MYSLFVAGHAGAWNGDPWTVDRDRCIREYTDDDIVKRFSGLDASQINELSRLPCVFAYETREKAPRFGFIRDVIVLPSQARVKITYDLVECEGFLTARDLSALETELDIRRFERGRTHWAVKDVDLYRVLLDEKGITLPQVEGGASNVGPVSDSSTDGDLWKPADAPRLFMSHLASCKRDVHDLSNMLTQFGFACFVAHDAIEPSREWRAEIERALNSCDILVAYVTPKFSESKWTDQEIGWALGRGLAAIPVSVGGETPRGFIGSYQAVKRTETMSDTELSLRVLRAICDTTFGRWRRRKAPAVAGKLVLLVTGGLGCASTERTALQFHDLLMRVPLRLWTPERRLDLEEALKKNKTLLSRTRPEGQSGAVIDILRDHLDGGELS